MAKKKVSKKSAGNPEAALLEQLRQSMQTISKGTPPAGATGAPPAAAKVARTCISIIQDTSMSPKARAEFLILTANEVGFDLMPPTASLIERADKSAELKKRLETAVNELAEVTTELAGRLLQPEVFLGLVERPTGTLALILTAMGPMLYPMEEEIEGLEAGECVLIDPKKACVVCRDGALPPTGEIVRIEEIAGAGDTLVTVKKRDETYTAHVSKRASDSPELRPGAQAIWDPHRQIVLEIIEPKHDGTDLLTPPERLARFSLDSLGAPHPVLFEILEELKLEVEHPDWKERMQVNSRRRYLFHGPTGCGKSTTIKVIVTELARWIEEQTGRREPRVVFCDASDFYSQWFGAGEERVKDWFTKLRTLAQHTVTTRDGRRIRVPLVVVFEEVEGLLRHRGEHGGSSHLFDRMLSLILKKMDSAESDDDAPVLFISTTNKKSLIDAAGRRRFGDRAFLFRNLDAPGALSVLEKKIAPSVPLSVTPANGLSSPRQGMLRSLIHFLYSGSDDQRVAEAVLRDSRRIPIHRRDLISGAVLESAVQKAKDECIRRSAEEGGELLGLSTGAVIEALDRQIEDLVAGFTPANLEDHVPHLLEGPGSAHIASVHVVARAGRRSPQSYAS